MRLSLTPGILTVALVGAMHARAAERPSFDCAKASTATERTICANDRLARLDRSLATVYRQLKGELAVIGEVFANEQTAFLKQRDACGADVACLVRHMEERRAALALERQSKAGPEEAFVGRYRSSYGWIILRRTLDRDYEMTGQTSDPNGRWTCDISGKVKSVEAGTATVEAGEDDDSRPLYLKVRRDVLNVTEDETRRLAGYTCGANGSVEGAYRRTERLN
jgi:uncharacterized protein YecT (DUF1311 family)